MYLAIIYVVILIFIIWLFMSIIKLFSIPSKVIKEYGVPNMSFWTSRYTFALRPSGINPTFICLYDSFILIQGLSDKWIIDKNNYVDFKQGGLVFPYTLKFKVDNIYKYEEIKFSMLSGKNAKLMQKLLNNFN